MEVSLDASSARCRGQPSGGIWQSPGGDSPCQNAWYGFSLPDTLVPSKFKCSAVSPELVVRIQISRWNKLKTRVGDIPPARHLAATLPSTSVSSETTPTVGNPKPEIHRAPSCSCIHKHEFAIRSSDSPCQSLLTFRIFPSKSPRPPSSDCTHSSSLLKIYIFLKNINPRHLAVVLATTFTSNLCHFLNFPLKSIYHCAPSSDNVKNPKPDMYTGVHKCLQAHSEILSPIYIQATSLRLI